MSVAKKYFKKLFVAGLTLLFFVMFQSAVLTVSAASQEAVVKQENDIRTPTPGEEMISELPDRKETAENIIRVSVQDAILMTMENNRSLAVERLQPKLQETFEQEQKAVFDPVLGAQVSGGRERGERALPLGGRESFDSKIVNAEIGVEKFFPAGTTIQVVGSSGYTDQSFYVDPLVQSRLGLSLTQALLRGFGTAVNLASVRQSRIYTQASLYELRGFSEALLSQVEFAYWDYALALRQIKIVEESLQVAEQQMQEADEMVQVGRLAELELVAAQAEIAFRRQELIEARSAMEVRRLQLLRLLNPSGSNPFRHEVILLSEPDLQQVALDDIEDHVSVALKMRPELNQARLGLERSEIEIVKTKNGTLPRMDFFITLGKSGYADSFGSSVGDISDDDYDALAGIRFEYPFRNRAASARHRRSVLSRDQIRLALDNLTQLVELDVRTAYIEARRARQQISASSETRRLEEEKLRVETEKFRVGRSTNFLVAQAQRDFLSSQLAEVQAIASYLKALTDMFRLEGSLLERRGIAAPVD